MTLALKKLDNAEVGPLMRLGARGVGGPLRRAGSWFWSCCCWLIGFLSGEKKKKKERTAAHGQGTLHWFIQSQYLMQLALIRRI